MQRCHRITVRASSVILGPHGEGQFGNRPAAQRLKAAVGLRLIRNTRASDNR
jgi:hypothetical protein